MINLHLPIRLRLTLWYVVLLAITFSLLGGYLFFRFQDSLRGTIDDSLNIVVSRTIAALDQEDLQESGQLSFDIVEKSQINPEGFAMRMISPAGQTWDMFGETQYLSNWGPIESGYTIQRDNLDDDDQWRILTQPVLDSNHQIIAWVQAAQSMDVITEALQDLQEQMLLAIPLILVFAGLGGYFLADRALHPMDYIATTAREISAKDLSRRLDYQGPQDEVGRLAQTIDGMLERLQASFEKERRFTSDAAHELRTPLTVLKGQIDVTLNRSRPPAEYQAKLRELSEHVDRLIRLSNALLFLSRSDKDQVPFDPRSVNLTEMLSVLIDQLHPLVDGKRLDFSIQLSDDLFVRGDNDLLTRLFMNLLENALKYSPADGQVQVSAGNEARGVRVTIHNSGEGIPAEHIQHLFERFYRADSDRSSQTGGLGLGLAISQEIVRLHDGTIKIDSQPGEGVSVTIVLPSAK